MTLTRLTAALILCLQASGAVADMIVINGRYVVHKEDVRGYFYRQNDQRMVFDIRWNDWSTQYRCNDTYDQTRVLAASLNFAIQLEEADQLDFGDFLEGEGFSGCAKF
ncbi:hypothetical protein So717_18530 [Roseobacter cerasinus]|uniref:Uncharacterized protein n=1 Tax=Roseobacter cerasinus TaxID=2602289 RepID=A0A640VRN7_9RHOB|nr:hypothetical protein [Roseobacter cerasinus]GFE50100.1 hypothetical protein So717_18530 [Roseobacter cerasinus]